MNGLGGIRPTPATPEPPLNCSPSADSHSSEKQAERRQRGEDFQNEIRRSWSLIPNSWRMRISDDCGSRPADEIVVTPDFTALFELKRKSKLRLGLSDIRPSQIKGLWDYERIGGRNHGVILVSFLNSFTDEAYGMQIKWFLHRMEHTGLNYVTINEMRAMVRGVKLPRLSIDGKPGYDLRELVKWLSA